MKFTVKRPVEIDISYIYIEVPVRYDEEDIPNDFPLRVGDLWKATVEIDTGKIINWPAAAGYRHIDMKVCDEGIYALQDAAGIEVARIDQDYVPDAVPGRYGDYIELEIDANGVITNWDKKPDISDFFPKD